MGVFQNNLLAGAAAAASAGGGGFYNYQIEQSVRFDDAGGSYLQRTLGSVTSNLKVSFSWWCKRNALAATNDYQMLFFVNDGGGVNSYFDNNDKIMLSIARGSGGAENMTGDRAYRDISGWTHFLYAVDTSNSTANYRLRFYVNGVEDTSSGYNGTQTQNVPCMYNKTSNTIYFGHNTGTDYQPDFSIAEFIHVDGTQLTPTDVGEFKNGVWIPKDYEGSYGNEGARLKFENSGDLGNDSSGNNNDWTANGMGADHQILDSPTFGS